MNAQPNYTLPSRVTAFLEAGPPPVCVTFGSMMLIRRGQFMQWVLDTLRELNQACTFARLRGAAPADGSPCTCRGCYSACC